MPDLTGLDLVLEMRRRGIKARFFIFSAYLDTPLVVQAMRLGAHDVLDKSADIDDLAARVQEAATLPPSRERPGLAMDWTDELQVGCGVSAFHRLADLAVRAISARAAPRTAALWGRAVGVGVSTLRETCHLASVMPHDGRDFARLLRAVQRSEWHGRPISHYLIVGDRRTLRKLMKRGGVADGLTGGDPLEFFLRHQAFLPEDHPTLSVVHRRLRLANGPEATRARESIAKL